MLLPSKFQPESLPSLGKLVAKAIAPKPADPIKAFEIGDHCSKSAAKWTYAEIIDAAFLRLSDGICSANGAALIGYAPSPQAEQPAPFKAGDVVTSTEGSRNKPQTWVLVRLRAEHLAYAGEWEAKDADGRSGILNPALMTLAPSQEAAKGDAEGWIAWDWQNDDAPDIPECARVDLKVMCRGELVEYPRQLCGFAMSHEHFFITHYRLSK